MDLAVEVNPESECSPVNNPTAVASSDYRPDPTSSHTGPRLVDEIDGDGSPVNDTTTSHTGPRLVDEMDSDGSPVSDPTTSHTEPRLVDELDNNQMVNPASQGESIRRGCRKRKRVEYLM